MVQIKRAHTWAHPQGPLLAVEKRLIASIGLPLLCLLAATAAAQTVGVEQCLQMESAAQRLRCYDALHGRDPAASQSDVDNPADVKPMPAATTEASSPRRKDRTLRTTQDDNALTADSAPGVGAPASDQQPAVSAIIGIIISDGQHADGRRWYRLDNGQLWEQTTPRRATIKPGDSVRLVRRRLGTYYLRSTDGSSRSFKVKRAE